MSTYAAPELRLPVPNCLSMEQAQAQITESAKTTPRVKAEPVPAVLLDCGDSENELQFVTTFAPEGDTAGQIKCDILRTINERLLEMA